MHRCNNVWAIGNLYTKHWIFCSQRSHAKWNDIHCATAHASAIQISHDGLHLGRIHPIICWTGICFIYRTDICAIFYASNVGGIRCTPERIWFFLKSNQSSGINKRRSNLVPFSCSTCAPINGIWLSQGGDFVHPPNELPVRSRIFTIGGRCSSHGGLLR